MENLLTLREAARRCGLSVRQIYKLAETGRFGPQIIRVARSVRVRESELNSWFQVGCPNRENFEASRGGVA